MTALPVTNHSATRKSFGSSAMDIAGGDDDDADDDDGSVSDGTGEEE